MPNKMLIDATHPEETRVVVVRGNRVEEFDFESAQRKQLRGNIYLAKVTRVEPSLQAAFIEYGGNRHGFLAFSEIHPDYYQIPVADRQALIEADERAHREAEEEPEDRSSRRRSRHRTHVGAITANACRAPLSRMRARERRRSRLSRTTNTDGRSRPAGTRCAGPRSSARRSRGSRSPARARRHRAQHPHDPTITRSTPTSARVARLRFRARSRSMLSTSIANETHDGTGDALVAATPDHVTGFERPPWQRRTDHAEPAVSPDEDHARRSTR